jgi:hypothetical protein
MKARTESRVRDALTAVVVVVGVFGGIACGADEAPDAAAAPQPEERQENVFEVTRETLLGYSIHAPLVLDLRMGAAFFVAGEAAPLLDRLVLVGPDDDTIGAIDWLKQGSIDPGNGFFATEESTWFLTGLGGCEFGCMRLSSGGVCCVSSKVQCAWPFDAEEWANQQPRPDAPEDPETARANASGGRSGGGVGGGGGGGGGQSTGAAGSSAGGGVGGGQGRGGL